MGVFLLKATSKKPAAIKLKKITPPKPVTSAIDKVIAEHFGSATKATYKLSKAARKNKAKEMILLLIKECSLSWPTAAARAREFFNYARTTPHKWLSDLEGEDCEGEAITYRDLVIDAERLALSKYQSALLRAAQGGDITSWSEEVDERVTLDTQGREKSRKKHHRINVAYSPPNPGAIDKGLLRKLDRLAELRRNPESISKEGNPVVVPRDEQDRQVNFTALTVTFGGQAGAQEITVAAKSEEAEEAKSE